MIILLFAAYCVCAVSAKYNAAFVFAGSARSFIEPFVHESIRFNLIHSFCPPKVCSSVVFARVSLSDNVHQVGSGLALRNGSGITLAGDITQRPRIEFALNRITKLPSSKRVVPLIVSWTEVGSESEKESMSKDFPSFRHRFFNQFDARRYSMYYNRYKSYQQIIEYERRNNMRFDWVVHARLDAIWGEAILPITYWNTLDITTNHVLNQFPKDVPSYLTANSNSASNREVAADKLKVWVLDTWYEDVPDPFALIPRHYSDAFFDLNALVADKVMCLGGPNIDQKVASETELIKYNYSKEEVKQILSRMLCKQEIEGFSERILKRKLAYDNITLSSGTLGYATFFSALIRPTLNDVCMMTEAQRLIGFVFDKQYANNAVVNGCLVLANYLRKYQPKYNAIVPSGDVMPKSLFTFTCILDPSTLEYSGNNCLLEQRQTDW